MCLRPSVWPGHWSSLITQWPRHHHHLDRGQLQVSGQDNNIINSTQPWTSFELKCWISGYHLGLWECEEAVYFNVANKSSLLRLCRISEDTSNCKLHVAWEYAGWDVISAVRGEM